MPPPQPTPTGGTGKRLPLWAWLAAGALGLLVGLLLLRRQGAGGASPEGPPSDEGQPSGGGGGGGAIPTEEAMEALGLRPPTTAYTGSTYGEGGEYFYSDGSGGTETSFSPGDTGLETYLAQGDYSTEAALGYLGSLPPASYLFAPGPQFASQFASIPTPAPAPKPAPSAPPAPASILNAPWAVQAANPATQHRINRLQ